MVLNAVYFTLIFIFDVQTEKDAKQARYLDVENYQSKSAKVLNHLIIQQL